LQGKSGCFAAQNLRFWKTKEKHPIFCKDISQSWEGEMECANSCFGVADTAMQGAVGA